MTRFAPKTVTERATGASIDHALLAYLRDLWGASVEYAEPPERITGGFDTTIYGFRLSGVDGERAQPLVVRIYRAGTGGEQPRFESVVQNTLAGLGYPGPKVLATCTAADVLTGPFTIMQRVRGRVMLSALFRPGFQRVPVTMGKLHAQLHSLDAAVLQRALADAGLGSVGWIGGYDLNFLRSQIESARLDGLLATLEWLESNGPPEPARPTVCHGDFHPLNVMLDGGSVSGVLDWAGTRVADPAWDVGSSIALFGQGPVDLPGPMLRAASVYRSWLLRRYLRAYTDVLALDMDAVRYYEALRCLVFLIEEGQYQQALAGVIPALPRPSPFHAKPVRDGIMRRVRAITGVGVALPPETKAAS